VVKIEWTHEAEIWLRDIYNYIATDNRDAARRTVAGIFEKVQLLTKYPRLGHPYEPEQSREVRILLYGHYRIAYLINLTRRQYDAPGAARQTDCAIEASS
jgi:plasmid stabilization system protein ParE